VRVTKKSALAGRKFRGRFYLPPAFVSEANVDAGGIIDAATLTAIQAHADNFHIAMGAAAAPHPQGVYILHRDGSAPTITTSLKVRTSVGTQRRRQPLL
jgi:hypothetical protein